MSKLVVHDPEIQISAGATELLAGELKVEGNSALLLNELSNDSLLSNQIRIARIKKLHRLNAILLLAFLLPHLGAHLFAIAGPQAHEAALDTVRWTYRPLLSEILLVTLLLSQICLGLLLARERLRIGTDRLWGPLQLVSGGISLCLQSCMEAQRWSVDTPTTCQQTSLGWQPHCSIP